MLALAKANVVYVGAVARATAMKAAERFDATGLIAFLQTQNITGYTAPTNRELLPVMMEKSGRGNHRPRLVGFFTNGSFDGIIGDFVSAMK